MAEIKIKTAGGGKLNEPKEPNKLKELLASLLFYLSILFFIIGFQFSDTMVNGWYQQFMPNLGGRSISDITFLDSLIGYATAYTTTDTNYLLKTIDSGNNWSIVYREYRIFNRVQFLNQNTGYICGGNFEKTTNGGATWTPLNAPPNTYSDMSILNPDTMWLVSTDGLTGGVYRTTNGGASWDRQLNLGSQNPTKIYMYNARIGFISSTAGLYKTTDGTNWFNVSNDFSFSDMFFIDSLIGWKASGFMKKTTNGGLNWTNQTLPSGGNIIVTSIEKFSNVNKDTIFGVSGYASTGLGARGMVYRTTNGGINWLFQIPDSNINIFRYLHNKFINKINGWAYNPATGIHTTTGGDMIFYTGIKQIGTNIPNEFELEQNYPNPFNPITKISYELSRGVGTGEITSYVVLSVYDIKGKKVIDLVNQKQNAGSYKVSFDGTNYSSGIYFYSLIVDGKLVDTKKMVLVK